MVSPFPIADDGHVGTGSDLDLGDRLAGAQRSRQSSAVRASSWSIGGRTRCGRRDLRRDILKIIINAEPEYPQYDAMLLCQTIGDSHARDEARTIAAGSSRG